jgi:hypothetical protein
MRAKELGKLFQATVRVKNPQYVGYVTAQVWAPSIAIARQLFKQQYHIQDHEVGNIKEVR